LSFQAVPPAATPRRQMAPRRMVATGSWTALNNIGRQCYGQTHPRSRNRFPATAMHRPCACMLHRPLSPASNSAKPTKKPEKASNHRAFNPWHAPCDWIRREPVNPTGNRAKGRRDARCQGRSRETG
jgi:hypothetical protein